MPRLKGNATRAHHVVFSQRGRPCKMPGVVDEIKVNHSSISLLSSPSLAVTVIGSTDDQNREPLTVETWACRTLIDTNK